MSTTAELRQLRAQLELERDRRAVAEDWSTFLASTLRAFLAARDAYERRPLMLSHGGLGSSSTDTDDDVRVADDRQHHPTTGRDCDIINGGVRAVTKLKRQFQRARGSSDEKTNSNSGSSQSKSTFHGDGSFGN